MRTTSRYRVLFSILVLFASVGQGAHAQRSQKTRIVWEYSISAFPGVEIGSTNYWDTLRLKGEAGWSIAAVVWATAPDGHHHYMFKRPTLAGQRVVWVFTMFEKITATVKEFHADLAAKGAEGWEVCSYRFTKTGFICIIQRPRG